MTKEEIYNKLISKPNFLFSMETLDKILAEKGNPFFFKALAIHEGIANKNRKPYPRIYTANAVEDFFWKAVDTEVFLGHKKDKNTETSDTLAKVFMTEMFYNILGQKECYIVAYTTSKVLEDKIKTTLMSTVSMDVNGVVYKETRMDDQDQPQVYEICDEITKVWSVDLINSGTEGILGAKIVSWGIGLDYLQVQADLQ